MTHVYSHKPGRREPVTTTHSSTQACPGIHPVERGNAEGLRVNTDHPTVNHRRVTSSPLGGKSHQGIKRVASAYHIMFPSIVYGYKKRSAKFNYKNFREKGQHAKPCALRAIMHKNMAAAGQVEGCLGGLSDYFSFFIEIFNIITVCVPSTWHESRFYLLAVQLVSVPFQSQFLAFKWLNGTSRVAAQLPSLISAGIQLPNPRALGLPRAIWWQGSLPLQLLRQNPGIPAWSPLTFNIHIQLPGKSCSIFLQNTPRTCLLLVAQWLPSSSLSSSSCSKTSPVASCFPASPLYHSPPNHF